MTTLKEIVTQLEKCNFKDETGHNIEDNISFIKLKELSEKYPVLLGDTLEVDIYGEIAGVKTKVTKKGRVCALTISSSESHSHINARVTNKLPSPYNIGEQPFGYKTIYTTTKRIGG